MTQKGPFCCWLLLQVLSATAVLGTTPPDGSCDAPRGDDKNLKLLAHWMGSSKNIMVLAGAGISVAAGIPDFRSPGTGLYDNLQKYNLPTPQAVFDLEFYQKNPQPFVQLAREMWPQLSQSSPTATHRFLKLLHDKGLLLRVYTQNIDGLEEKAGIPPEKVVECHGHFRTASCTKCGKAVENVQTVYDSIVEKGKVPLCLHCGAYVKPDIVFFGESLPDRFQELLMKDLEEVDLLLVMGTSLQVAPVSLIPRLVDKTTCKRVLFNKESVVDDSSDDSFLYVQGDCDTNVKILASLLGWDLE